MPSKLTLSFYYWRYQNLNNFSQIQVLPDTTVDEIKEHILQKLRINSPSDLTDLYRPPPGHVVSLDNFESTLGPLSISDLPKPLPGHRTMRDIFGQRPEKGVLHLVLVDRATFTVGVWIPSTQDLLRLPVNQYDTVGSLLPAIKEKSPALKEGATFAFYKTPYNNPNELLGATRKDQPLHNFTVLLSVFRDIPVLEFPCITMEVVQKRKRDFSESEDAAAKLKKRLVINTTAPSSFEPSVYYFIQGNMAERIYDYRERYDSTANLPEKNLPPFEVLFPGFGEFLDIWQDTSASFRPDSPAQDVKVRKFADAMSKVYADETSRSANVLQYLDEALFRGRRGPIQPGDIPQTSTAVPPARCDGLSRYGSGIIPCIIVELKNEEAGSRAIPILELVAYYARILNKIAVTHSNVVNGSRLPMLGITTIGPNVKFYGVAHVGHFVYVPLTTDICCLPIDCGGGNRYQLYRAFKAASVLLQSIEREAERLTQAPPTRIERPLFPQLNKLLRYHDPSSPSSPPGNSQYVEFQITGFVAKDLNRHVYSASSSDGDLIIKLTRTYSPELHALCARHDFAPKLYAYERLAGGIFAVAMEHIKGEPLSSHVPAEFRDKRTRDLEEIVRTMHDEDYVHGDLRLPNIMHAEERIVLLDFDWGGKVGEAWYPHTYLNPDLTEGRDMSSLQITKDDDDRVLRHTLQSMRVVA